MIARLDNSRADRWAAFIMEAIAFGILAAVCPQAIGQSATDSAAQSVLQSPPVAETTPAAHAPSSAPAANTLPLWEFGLGVAATDFPFYLGADQTKVLPLPFPVGAYRGRFFRADRDGVRGVLFDSRSIDLSLSVGASPPVYSDGSDARAGMPDLRPSLEFGPALNWTLWRSNTPGNRLKITVPLRAVFTIHAPPQFTGWSSDPRVNLDLADPKRFPGWHLGLQAGPLYASRRQNEYYYSVAPAYATATRPAYDAAGGRSGVAFTTAISKRYPRYYVGAFLRYDSIRNAVFESSPLVRRDYGVYGGVGIAWMIGESSERVPRTEDDD